MASVESNAAWNPAFMPDTLPAPPTAKADVSEQAPPPLPAKTEPAQTLSERATGDDLSLPDSTHDAHSDSGADSWFPEYDASGVSLDNAVASGPTESQGAEKQASDVAPEPVPEATSVPESPAPESVPGPESPSAPAPPTSAETSTEAAEPESTSDHQAHHQSTSSFARTVSNDVNWDAEDDDPEWNLPRANTDPFKFMAPSDRTNSFPVVPLPEAEDANNPSESQNKMQIMGAIQKDQEEVAAASAAPPQKADDAWGLGDDENDADHSFFDGNGTQSTWNTPEVPDERFEEGVPLISQQNETVSTPVEAEPKKSTADLFSQVEADADDDFFSSVTPAADSDEAAQPPNPPTFERKSTMQVLQSMNVGSLTRNDSITESIAEDATEQEDGAPSQPNGESAGDLAAQWAAALADADDDDDLLEDSILETDDEPQTKELDPAAIFGDDDDGFLDDELPEEPAVQQGTPVPQASAAAYPTASRYLPPGSQSPAQQQTNPYFPSTPFVAAQPAATSRSNGVAQVPDASNAYSAFAQPQQAQQAAASPVVKAQSFADKSKGGYHSPYDLPMDVVKPPRKRQSMQQLRRPNDIVAGLPPRPPSARVSSLQQMPSSPLKDSFSPDSPPTAPSAAPTSKPDENFFEDLPMLPKPRPGSRHSGMPSPALNTAYAPPPPPAQHTLHPSAHVEARPNHYAPPLPPPALPQASPSMSPQAVPPPALQYTPASALSPQNSTAPQPPNSDISKLVAPPRMNPYAPTTPSLPPPHNAAAPAPTLSRYASAPNLQNGIIPASQPSRYSPAPSSRASSGGYAPTPVLPHQPRTSSPLAHFEMSYEKPRALSTGHTFMLGEGPALLERRNSSSIYEPRLPRIPSLPPTREVEEEDGGVRQRPSTSGGFPHRPPSSSQFSPSYAPQQSRQQTPPLPAQSLPNESMLSPPKRVLNYMPQQATERSYSPPPRAQTQSPGSLHGNRATTQPANSIPRPSSAHDMPPPSRPRASSNLNLVPPTDGTESDLLRRWRGAPVFAWGMGGTFVSSYPQDVPRYGMNQAMPTIHRAPGEVQVKNIKELYPVEERLAKFPGPLKGKSKKKDVLVWLSTGIEGLEQSLHRSSFPLNVSHDDKRLEERLLLWKLLRVFVEYDGVLEGTAAVEKAVRDVLSPYTADELSATAAPAAVGLGLAGYPGASDARALQSDAVDNSVMEQIRKDLLLGNKEKAAWDAVDKRLWGHAFLIASAASRDLFKQVAQEFVRKEVNGAGQNNESLAALYEVLSGNHEECVDELVPVHARAGLQLISTQPTAGQPSKDALSGLDKWRETLCLILSNRSPDDTYAIHSLGKLLSGYGRAEAAHVCFLFSRQVAVFGGLDDPAASFVLLGADHRTQVDLFAKETDAVLLSEVYEYGLSLAGGPAAGAGCPHLSAYKLQHAMSLAEYGLRDKALQYCEAILASFSSQTRRSPYHHALLEATVEDLMKRLKLAPREESNSWIPKPSMNKVSDTVWNRFNKFVAGDDNDGTGATSDGEGGAESGPFARIASGTPTISRPPSSAGGAGTGMEMFGGPNSYPSQGYGMLNGAGIPPARSPSVPATTRTTARYAPSAVGNNPYEPMNGGYAPLPDTSSAYIAPENPRLARQPSEMSMSLLYSDSHSNYAPRQGLSRKSSYAPLSSQSDTGAPAPVVNPYAPPMTASEPVAVPDSPEKKAEESLGPDYSYQPSSYGYEPPATAASSFEPATSDGRPSTAPVGAGQGMAAQLADAYSSSYDAPSFAPYGYEPPSFEPPAGNTDLDDGAEDSDEAPPKPKKDYFDEVDDDIPALRKPAEKTREEKDREAAERFRKAAEEDAKRAEEEKAAKAKKGWGLTSWLIGSKKEAAGGGGADDGAPKAIRANLGEKSSFYYDPELKRWVNKNASAADQAAKATPPPPPPRSQTQSTVPSEGASAPVAQPMGMAAPPLGAPPPGPSSLSSTPPSFGGPPPMRRTASAASTASGPSSRPSTSMGEATSIEDLLGAAAAGGSRKAGTKRGRKGGRYVDVMAK